MSKFFIILAFVFVSCANPVIKTGDDENDRSASDVQQTNTEDGTQVQQATPDDGMGYITIVWG